MKERKAEPEIGIVNRLKRRENWTKKTESKNWYNHETKKRESLKRENEEEGDKRDAWREGGKESDQRDGPTLSLTHSLPICYDQWRK